MTEQSPIDLTDVTEEEDPRLSAAADEVIAGFRAMAEQIDPVIVSALIDLVAERLDEFSEELEVEIESDENDDDNRLLSQVDE